MKMQSSAMCSISRSTSWSFQARVKLARNSGVTSLLPDTAPLLRGPRGALARTRAAPRSAPRCTRQAFCARCPPCLAPPRHAMLAAHRPGGRVKPAPFEYFAPRTVDEALGLLERRPEARPLAGGQSLVPMMNLRLAQPEALVDLNRTEGLADLEPDGDGI